MGTSPSAEPIWSLVEGESPIIAVALHDGHDLRGEVAELCALSSDERLREEDPFTGKWTAVAKTQIVGLRSRFEVDLNRPREKAIYLKPEDAWGLNVYREEPSDDLIQRTLAAYDAFYHAVQDLFSRFAETHKRFVVLDIHSYNHRRAGPDAEPANAHENPEVNLGTGTMPDRRKWASLIDRFNRDLSSADYDGGHLDVRENVKFFGGSFAKWTHENFPESACVLSVELKKFFMDEWSGKLDEDQHGMIQRALESTIPGILQSLER